MLTQHENMKKTDALQRINGICGVSRLNSGNTLFSNVNNSEPVWWFNVPLQKIKDISQEHLNFICYDRRSYKLYHLKVPTSYLKQHLSSPQKLRIRDDRQAVNLEWCIDTTHQFVDRESGCRFVQFRCCEVSCEHS
jgi:hypothetical protein